MPVSSGKLRRLVKSKHSLVERHLNTVINLIRGAIENCSEFESIAEELRNARLEVSQISQFLKFKPFSILLFYSDIESTKLLSRVQTV